MSVRWHVITGEYPPQPGGVSDYTRVVARGLAAAGDAVDVWAPACAASQADDGGVSVHRLRGHFDPRSLAALRRALDARPGPRRLLVQYVPHAFGYKGMNLPFCLWLRTRRDPVWVMFHEVAYPWSRSQPARHNALSAVTRLMARLVAQAAERVFVSIPAWAATLRAVAPRAAAAEWLPIPATVPVVSDAKLTERVRRSVPGGSTLVGHLGTYGRFIAEPLEAALLVLLERRTDCVALLLGRGGDAARERLIRRRPALTARVVGPGFLPPDELSAHLSACDVMLQPYADGVSSRRTSAMTALAHGLATVTTSGFLTEPLWSASGAVALAPAGNTGAIVSAVETLVDERDRRDAMRAAARALYDQRFHLRHTLAGLRDARRAVPPVLDAALAGPA